MLEMFNINDLKLLDELEADIRHIRSLDHQSRLLARDRIKASIRFVENRMQSADLIKERLSIVKRSLDCLCFDRNHTFAEDSRQIHAALIALGLIRRLRPMHRQH